MKEMTDDTRRALEAIAPLAKELNVTVSADHNFLYCNGQAIGIGCNSTFATLMEFIGYLMVKVYAKDLLQLRGVKLTSEFVSVIKRYWYTTAQYTQFCRAVGEPEAQEEERKD